MQTLTKNVFLIVGAMVVSLLFFQLVFGDKGRQLIWQGVEPVYQTTWERHTMNDGQLVSETITNTFDNVVEVTE